MSDSVTVVVEPLLVGGGRPVRVQGEVFAVVRGPAELDRLLERIRQGFAERGESDEVSVVWHGGGPEAW